MILAKVDTATSNDSWGPSGTDMSEIAQMTFNKYMNEPVARDLIADTGLALATSLILWK